MTNTPFVRFQVVRSYIASEKLRTFGFYTTAVEQEGIFIVPHMLLHGPTVFAVSAKGLPHLITLYDKQGVFPSLADSDILLTVYIVVSDVDKI